MKWIILTVASKLFGHVTFYVADEESGSRCSVSAWCAQLSSSTERHHAQVTNKIAGSGYYQRQKIVHKLAWRLTLILISRSRHYSALSISETILDRHTVSTTESHMCPMDCAIANDLDRPARSIQLLWRVSPSVYEICSMYNVRSQLQVTTDGRREQLFLLLYLSGWVSCFTAHQQCMNKAMLWH